jgi:4'-phosphopantetheinyl transferase
MTTPDDAPLHIPPDEVHLWLCFAPVAESTGVEAAGLALMSADERERHRRLVFERDRTRYLLTRMLARQALARYVGISPQRLQFRANSYGRPFLAEQPVSADGPVSFNLTHTDGLIVLALTRGLAIGVDAECVRRTVDPDLARSVFSPSEIASFAALPRELQRRRFLDLWTLKESYIKARGMGLSLPLDRFSFHFPSPEDLSLEFAEGFDDTPARWDVRQLRPRSEHLVALCVERGRHPAGRLVAREFVPLKACSVVDLPVARATGCGVVA